MAKWFLFLALLLCATAQAADVRIDGVRTWAGPERTRVVFDLSSPAEHRLFTLSNPARVVIDLSNAAVDPALIEGAETDGVLGNIRSGRRGDGTLRVVFDLRRRAHPQSFLLKPNDQYGHRLVVDLERPRENNAPVRRATSMDGELLIAIDAGHGGEDPGAIGKHGTHEKDVVLAVARKLASLVDRQPGMRAMLIRGGDYYLGLRERTRRAREAQADLFVSIHADAFRDRSVRGSSVYVLSERGASSEMARFLAQSENEADRIGGVSLEDKDELVASVLVDLSRAATIESSNKLAGTLLNQLDRVGPVHRDRVERAGFVVLKSVDMPSVLVELAFISNPREERLLRSKDHQWELASALESGIVRFARENLRPVVRMADNGRSYTVRSGDTLSEIARRYGVSISRLRRANDLRGDMILAGTELTIP